MSQIEDTFLHLNLICRGCDERIGPTWWNSLAFQLFDFAHVVFEKHFHLQIIENNDLKADFARFFV